MKKIIFDIGLHKGKDAFFYLKKGFKVIGVEANPLLVDTVSQELFAFVDSKDLIIVNKAIYDSQEEVKFFVNLDKDEWSSLNKLYAGRQGSNTLEIKVETVNILELCKSHGVPYYIKIDIEGSDMLCLKQVLESNCTPQFLSVEAAVGNWKQLSEQIKLLQKIGYDRFQIINQVFNPQTKAPFPAKEGDYFDMQFDWECSGLFGLELPLEDWLEINEFLNKVKYMNKFNTINTSSIEKYSKFKKLNQSLIQRIDSVKRAFNLPWGWWDIHATTDIYLKSVVK